MKKGAFPNRIEIELASACNLRCTYCPRKHMDNMTGMIDPDLFKKLIDEAACYPDLILVLHRRGESLMHPKFSEMCRYVKGKFKDIQLATNATLLDEDKSGAIIESVSFISFSIDTPDNFNRTRVPAKYADVESNILRFLKMNRGRVQTQVSMVRTQDTPEECPELFKSIWSGKVDRIRIYEEHSRDGRFGSLTKGRSGRMPCAMPNYEMLVYCDGKVGRCNHDWNGEPMGDAGANSLSEIWNNEKYAELRRQHAALEITDPVCKDCDSWYAEPGKQGTGEVVEDD